jgi:hypothetical protein
MEILYTKSLEEFYSSNDDMCFYCGYPIFKESARMQLDLFGYRLKKLFCMDEEELKIPLYELKKEHLPQEDGPFIPGYGLMTSLIDIRRQLDIILGTGKKNIVYCFTIQEQDYMFIHVDVLEKLSITDCLDVRQSWLDDYKILYVDDLDFTYWLINEERYMSETCDFEFHGNIFLKKDLNCPIVINDMNEKKEKLRRFKRLENEKLRCLEHLRDLPIHKPIIQYYLGIEQTTFFKNFK